MFVLCQWRNRMLIFSSTSVLSSVAQNSSNEIIWSPSLSASRIVLSAMFANCKGKKCLENHFKMCKLFVKNATVKPLQNNTTNLNIVIISGISQISYTNKIKLLSLHCMELKKKIMLPICYTITKDFVFLSAGDTLFRFTIMWKRSRIIKLHFVAWKVINQLKIHTLFFFIFSQF